MLSKADYRLYGLKQLHKQRKWIFEFTQHSDVILPPHGYRNEIVCFVEYGSWLNEKTIFRLSARKNHILALSRRKNNSSGLKYGALWDWLIIFSCHNRWNDTKDHVLPYRKSPPLRSTSSSHPPLVLYVFTRSVTQEDSIKISVWKVGVKCWKVVWFKTVCFAGCIHSSGRFPAQSWVKSILLFPT